MIHIGVNMLNFLSSKNLVAILFGIDIGIYTQDFENEFISLTDIARYKSDDPTAVIQNWMRNRDVIEFLGLWERLHMHTMLMHLVFFPYPSYIPCHIANQYLLVYDLP